VLRARLHMVHGELCEARAVLEALAAHHPWAFAPLLWLGNVLIAERHDWAAAERAVRAALAIAPANAVCRRNLDRVLREHGRQG
jgi:hypothetical protein